ncbi:MAG: adenylosuccinate synthase [Firmicutes bacterium]|nr:adenylosuccinate synthase [Bacillota bacterium]
MPVTAVVGAQWGDEGKGKIVDWLAENADMVIRFQGGNNAGHTVVNQLGEFRLHIVPCGIFNPQTTCIIGTGTVVNPLVLLEELQELEKAGIDTQNLLISARAHLLMPYHVLLDKLEEQARGEKSLGTTLRGIGPCYVDKVQRSGIQVGDLLDPDFFRQKVYSQVQEKNKVLQTFYNHEPLDAEQIAEQVLATRERLLPHIKDVLPIIHKALAADQKIVLEGQLGALKDLDWGTYPYVTSSNPLAGGAAVGAGIPPHKINDVLGIVKAYSTSVGKGAMPTELHDEMGERIRTVGREFGATTGRPRRCGWFDAAAVRYAHMLNGFTRLCLTKLDVLDSFEEIKVCIGYELDGQRIDTFPEPHRQEDVKPIYETLPGWQADTSKARSFADLPLNAQRYVQRIEALVGAPIRIISVGPERSQTFLV